MDPGEVRAAAGPVTALLLGVAFLLDRWAPAGVAFLLDRWAPAGVPFLLSGVAALAGIGFMVSLLIGELAYGVADRRAEYVRIGVLASSLFAAALAAVIFRSRNRAYRGLAAIEERDSDADGIPDVYDATTPVTTGSAPPTAHSAAGTPRGWG
jgi:Na+:H+ antiporter, NhaA family